jgi:hypothetical protein
MKDVQIWVRAEWDRVAACGVVLMGAIALFLGYQGISGSAYVSEQLAYLISGGIGGLFLLGVGATLFLSADLHDEWRKLDDLEAAIRGSRESDSGGPNGPGESLVQAKNGTRPAANDKADLLATASTALARSAPLSSTSGARRKGWSSVTPPAAGLLQMRAGVAGVCGAVALAVTWLNASGHADTATSLGDVSRSSAVLLAVGAVLAVYLGTLRREVGRRSVRVVGALAYALDITQLAMPSREVAQVRAAPENSVVLGRGMTRYHVPGCPMLESIARTRRVSVDKAAASAQPCELCNAPAGTRAEPEGAR